MDFHPSPLLAYLSISASDIVRNFLKIPAASFKKEPVCLAEIIMVFPILCNLKAMSPAAGTADPIPLTLSAIATDPPRLFYKSHRPAIFKKFLYFIFIKTSEPIFVQDIKIAGINAAIRLGHTLNTADSPLLARLRQTPHQNTDIIFKLPDIRGSP